MFVRQVDESEKYYNHVQSLRGTYIIACSMPRSVSSKNNIGRTSERPPQHKNQKLSSAQNPFLPRWSQKFTTSRTITTHRRPTHGPSFAEIVFRASEQTPAPPAARPGCGTWHRPAPRRSWVGKLGSPDSWNPCLERTSGTSQEKNPSRDPSRDPYPHPHVEASGTAPFPRAPFSRSTRVTRVTRVTPRRQVSTKPRDSKASSGTATSRPRWYSSRVLITSWPLRRTFPESRSPEKGPYRTARLSLRFLFKGIRKETLPSLDFGGFQIRF